MRWTKSKDGEMRVSVHVHHRLTRIEIVNVLARAILSYGDDYVKPTKAAIEKLVRDELYWKGKDATACPESPIPEDADQATYQAKAKLREAEGRD